MTDTRAAELISRNLTAIYGYAFARLYDKEKVDDLTSEIVCEILMSAKNLRSEDAFWGFAWKIAENTFRKFIRKEETTLPGLYEPPSEKNLSGLYEPSPEEVYIKREENDENLYRLRRELSLLTKTHREVCVAYYVENKSCSEIAKERNISVEMVKYHLFKTRKLLKEGIGMIRPLGEKSYNPGVFRHDFWGDQNRYWDLFSRKLPGSIVLAAYHVPMSAEELSIELGVSMPYLEEEIETLEAAGVLTKNGNKYQTNLVIITDEYEKEFVKKTSHIYKSVANQLYEETRALLPAIRRLPFHGNDFGDNRLLIELLNLAMVKGYWQADEKSPIGELKPLALGGNGWVFGYDNDYINCHFHGITHETRNKAETAWFTSVNYRVFESCAQYDHARFSEQVEAVCDAILGKEANYENEGLPLLLDRGFVRDEGGKLSPNFPVCRSDVYEQICGMLRFVSEITADCMIQISDLAEMILKDHVPDSVKDQCGDIAKIHHRLDVAAFLMETLVAEKKLAVPLEKKTPVGFWGVIR